MEQFSPVPPNIQEHSLVFVTGATGLLGSNLIRELAAQGYRIRALVRSEAKARRFLSDVEMELVVGDMQDVTSFAGRLDGCAAVFHTAAFFREYYERPGNHDEQIERINVQGTVALMQAADDRQVGTFIHASSSGAVGSKPDGTPGDEDTPPSKWQRRNAYFRSKIEGDCRVRAFQPRSGMRVVEVLPGWMWGPGDAGPTAAGRCALDFVAKKIPAIPDGGNNFVDARDVARAMITCARRAEHGARFIVAGPFCTMQQLFDELESVTGVSGPRMRVPFSFVYAYAYLLELRVRLFGGKLLVSREAIRTTRQGHNVSSARAQRELGVTFRPLAQTLSDTITWYRQYGFITQ